jgi:pimeloyl-ACP methyl ester carboxylesterase
MKRAARANTLTYPKTFRARRIPANGIKLYVRVGGRGPAVVLLHGYGETGDMWVPLAKDLAHGSATSSPPPQSGSVRRPAGTTRSSMPAQARCMRASRSSQPSATTRKRRPATITRWSFPTCAAWGSLPSRRAVTHDIGNMVGYAFAAQYRDRVTCFVVIDAPLPGVGPWEQILKNRLLWHFRFGGPDMERSR